ncbi:HAD family hydrolase [Siccirubricoccus deserti]|uniref:HAD family hydrolase n=1 Tax=Siccirubricoccus deserti TaxID=2013562 RepID=UPI001E616190|nr:HAD family phosphatase [Siccirubricoccus deserti]
MTALRIDAVVFDMDGLLLDTESLAMRGLAQAATEMGLDAPEEFCHAMIGVPTDHCRILVAERFGPDFPADDFLAAASQQMGALIDAGSLQLKPGVPELLDHLDGVGMARAVATSSSRAKAHHHLRRTGILGRFDAVVTRDDVARGKPHPDLFLRAAQVLGRRPERCLALEDSYNGVRAAHAAGMQVIMVPDLLPPTTEVRETCLLIATDLHAVQPLISRPA